MHWWGLNLGLPAEPGTLLRKVHDALYLRKAQAHSNQYVKTSVFLPSSHVVPKMIFMCLLTLGFGRKDLVIQMGLPVSSQFSKLGLPELCTTVPDSSTSLSLFLFLSFKCLLPLSHFASNRTDL